MLCIVPSCSGKSPCTLRIQRTIVYYSSSCWHKSQSSQVLHKKRDSRLQIQVHLNPSSERRHQGLSSVICHYVSYILFYLQLKQSYNLHSLSRLICPFLDSCFWLSSEEDDNLKLPSIWVLSATLCKLKEELVHKVTYVLYHNLGVQIFGQI